MKMTPAEALALVASLRFRPFEASDKKAFPGCESENPLIANREGVTVLVDGDFIEIYAPLDGGGEKIFQFELAEPQFIFKTGRDA